MKSIALYYSRKQQVEAEPEGMKSAPVVDLKMDEKIKSVSDKKKSEQSNELKTELHMNIWKVEEGRIGMTPRFYFDFGVMFPKDYKAICLFLPFEVEGTVEDLSAYLTGKQETLSAVFNADTRSWAHKNPNYHNVLFSGDDKKFYFYKLGPSNYIKKMVSEKPQDGFFLIININGDVDDKDSNDIDSDVIYVRFRLLLAKGSKFIRTEQISNDLLQAAFSSTDLIDIRINENRVLDTKIRERMEQREFIPFEFDKIHLFYMVDTRENVDNGSSLKQDTRLVEQEQWGNYTPKTSLHNTTFVAYHWKKRRKIIEKEEPIKSFNVFFSTIYPKTNFERLGAYVFVVVLLGFLGSMLSFDVTKVKCDNWHSLVKPIIVLVMSVLVFFYYVKRNFGGKCFEIYRKR